MKTYTKKIEESFGERDSANIVSLISNVLHQQILDDSNEDDASLVI